MSMDKTENWAKMLVDMFNAKNPPRENDFRNNGILFCGNCLTPKQERVFDGNEEYIYPVRCRCEELALAEERRQWEEEYRAVRAAELRRLSMMDSEAEKWTFSVADKSGDNGRSMTICERYVEKFPQMLSDNRGLLLFGEVGTGKTVAAACIANALLDRDYSVVMTSLVILLEDTGKSEEIIRRMNEIDLLILDDLGAERSTDYGFERIYAVCDARYRCGKPVIYTSNLPLDTFKHAEDIRCARIFDRVLERCYPVEFRGVSRRKREARRGFEEMNELLGVNEIASD